VYKRDLICLAHPFPLPISHSDPEETYVNRSLILLFLVLAPALSAHCQSNNFINQAFSRLGQNGLSVSLQLYADTFAGTRANSGLPKAAAFQFFDLSSMFELRTLSPGLTGTRIFTSFHGNGSYAADFAGAYQSVAGISCPPGIHFAEVWIERPLTKSATLRLGKIDANADFASVEGAKDFLNAAFSYDPTFYTLPNYSATNWGGELLVHGEHRHANVAVFSPSDGTGPLLMEEVGAEWSPGGWKGRIALGAWQSTGSIPSFSGLNEKGSRGVYFVGEQTLWRQQRSNEKQEQSFTAFVQLGSAPAAFSTFTRHLGAGLIWNRPLARRDRDSAGLAVSRGRFTSDPTAAFDYRYETVFETYYRFQMSNRVSVSPDFQYAVHPGGVDSSHNVYVVGARITFSLNSPAE
jgi:carbohydrate-selective porin OprB